MENHPIPQDVTGFQFKLIGDMTVKQFAYLVAGVLLAGFFYILPFPAFIQYPFILTFSLTGVALAFLPIEGRPMDVMVTNFFRALFTPTQYVYHKEGRALFPKTPSVKTFVPQQKAPIMARKDKLQAYLAAVSLPTNANRLDEREKRFAQLLTGGLSTTIRLSYPPQQTTAQKSQHVSSPVYPPPPKDAMQQAVLEKEAALLKKELEEAKKQDTSQNQATPQGSAAHQKVLSLEGQLHEILAQKERLQEELVALKKQMGTQQAKVFSPSAMAPKQTTQHVRIVPKSMEKSVGLPITPDVPNLITGIVKDSRGNVLPNILVEVKDREGNPVRAFKTNLLGQFASASMLTNGAYTVLFEDPQGKHKFDTIELVAEGKPFSPIEVISEDERETLRKALFDTNAAILQT